MRQKIRKSIQGFMILIFPLIFLLFSPFLILKAAQYGVIGGSAVVFILMMLFSIVGSRLFCGWVCASGAIQDYAAGVNPKKWNSPYRNMSKYIIWVIWAGVIFYLFFKNPPQSVQFFYMYKFSSRIAIVYFSVVILIYLLSLFVGKRFMCHSICWLSPFMVIGEKIADKLRIPRMRLKADSSSCISCGICTKNCPMSLEVQEMVQSIDIDSTECIYCMNCIDRCPKNAITCGISRK